MLLQYHQQELIEAGCDEAGRGCLAGPVVAAAVILPVHFENTVLNDSKKLSAGQRNELKEEIMYRAIAYGIGVVDNAEIDRINILNASIKAMHLALAKIEIGFGFILVDGNRFHSYKDIPHQCIVKGDGKYLSIAAASVLAKTYRDELMESYHETYPQYGWNQNKGYPTLLHREAIRNHGTTEYHRQSFNLLPIQYNLFT